MSMLEVSRFTLLKAAVVTAIGCHAFCASASHSITIYSVRQRWPWNNKVDISYTVNGGQDVTNGVFAKIVFNVTVGEKSYTIDGVHDVGASASDGKHTVTWIPPADLKVKPTDCTISATLSSAENPSGDDYMIIDLDTGEITYEGLLASQEASNDRYNKNDAYKSTKLLLRKVPKWSDYTSLPNASALASFSGYPTGDANNIQPKRPNTPAYWATSRDYYIGVYPVTQAQYEKICGENPSSYKTPREGENVSHRPVENMSWRRLRGDDPIAQSIPLKTVDTKNTGSFLQRLNYITGNRYGFDLPTEVMFEIAERAGATTQYFWGDDVNDLPKYCLCTDNQAKVAETMAVGSWQPNNWGLYDMAGNVWEFCLDDNNPGEGKNASEYSDDMSQHKDAFSPSVQNPLNNMKISRGGSRAGKGKNEAAFKASYRTSLQYDKNSSWYGFRVACIMR